MCDRVIMLEKQVQRTFKSDISKRKTTVGQFENGASLIITRAEVELFPPLFCFYSFGSHPLTAMMTLCHTSLFILFLATADRLTPSHPVSASFTPSLHP